MAKNSTEDFLKDTGREYDAEKAKALSHEPEVDRSGWGFFIDEFTHEEYFADPCPVPSLSSSIMKPVLNATMAEAKYAHLRYTPDPEKLADSLAKITGDVVHQLVLGKGRGYVVAEFDNWRTNASKEYRDDAAKDGKTAILKKDFEPAQEIAAHVIENIKVALDGADYETEVVALAEFDTPLGPIWCRGMFDIFCPERAIILDPKITDMLGDGKIDRHAADMGWDMQGEFYKMLATRIEPKFEGRIDFANLLQSTKEPFVHRLWGPDAAWQYSCQKQIEIAMYRWAKAQRDDNWPGYSSKRTQGEIPIWVDRVRISREMEFLAESKDG